MPRAVVFLSRRELRQIATLAHRRHPHSAVPHPHSRSPKLPTRHAAVALLSTTTRTLAAPINGRSLTWTSKPDQANWNPAIAPRSAPQSPPRRITSLSPANRTPGRQRSKSLRHAGKRSTHASEPSPRKWVNLKRSSTPPSNAFCPDAVCSLRRQLSRSGSLGRRGRKFELANLCTLRSGSDLRPPELVEALRSGVATIMLKY
jgi:hypothetical protein